MNPKTTVLLPLYVYPHPDAWKPLYDVISAYPGLDFVVIINPNSGPGTAPWWPNEDYVREIPRLNSYPNVQTVGYVRAAYCKRALDNVFEDIQTYAIRPEDDSISALEMQGIFVDETPNLYSPRTKQYLDDIDKSVKAIKGFGVPRLTIHNPGTSVNKELASPGPAITVVVETSYARFVTKDHEEWLATSPYDRSRTCYMLHSVPEEKVGDLTIALRKRAAYLFITSSTADFYESFHGSSWSKFVAAMALG